MNLEEKKLKKIIACIERVGRVHSVNIDNGDVYAQVGKMDEVVMKMLPLKKSNKFTISFSIADKVEVI